MRDGQMVRHGMLPESASRPSSFAPVVTGLLFGLSLALLRAEVLTWDSDSNKQNGPTDGSGIWNQMPVNKVWLTANFNAVVKWANAQFDDAVIGAGGTAGTLTLGENIVARSLTFQPTAVGFYAIAGPYTLTLSTGATPPHQVFVTNNHRATISAVLAGPNHLLKWGAETLVLSAANTYTGNTVIQQGVLRISNTSGSGTGSGNVTINAAGTLAGNGNVSGAVIVNGTVSPGNSVGALTTGAQTWNAGGKALVEMKDVDAGEGAGWDFLTINGALTVTATPANRFQVDLRSLTPAENPGLIADFDPTQSYTWRLVSTRDGITFAGGDESTVFDLLLGGFYNHLQGGSFSLSRSSDNRGLLLNFRPIPEPGTLATLGLGLSALGWLACRGRR